MAAEQINIDFGRRLRKIRKYLKMNQDDMAAVCGFEPAAISRLERGETNATLTTLLRLSQGLNISLSDLVDMKQEYKEEITDEKLLNELQRQMKKLSTSEQKFVLEFVNRFVILKKEPELPVSNQK